jgi:hypothetical protein
MLARVKAMVRHYNRSHTIESVYLKEEETGFYPDEYEYWCEKPSLWWRGHKALWNGSAIEYNYFVQNTE